MKINLTVDCTPEEARTFFGLPDVKPLQEAMLKELEQRLKASLEAMQPEALFKTWFPGRARLRAVAAHPRQPGDTPPDEMTPPQAPLSGAPRRAMRPFLP